MSDIAIRVDHLGKQFRIGKRERYKTLRESVTSAITAPFLRWTQRNDQETDTIWALKDVSFEVKKGDVVGIIGRNGAGKSTLLKVLSQITEPTQGQVELFGRIGSLLEVGTGFHPELTGRENIYLNGAILGMKRAEITRKFDEIVAFSEIEKFLDTPVKRYSSGMYMRLAFAVAAHLEPEILVVDEVLAVGDAQFQKKCLGKMGEVAKQGRTVLFVSHQMNAIRRLCTQCIWLNSGRIQAYDSTSRVIATYESSFMTQGDGNRDSADNARTTSFLRWELVEPRGDEPNVLHSVEPITFKTTIRVGKPVCNGVHGIALWDSERRLIWAASYEVKLDAGTYDFTYKIPALPLRPGNYSWLVSLYDDQTLLDQWSMVPDMVVATTPHCHPLDEWAGILNLPSNFYPIVVRSQ